MRAIWKGTISFGLVSIPISLYPATRREELKFRLLRASDLSPVNYKRVAEADGKEVPWEEIVKGYEYENGKFVVLKDEDFRRADVEATQSIDIVKFVALKEIDPIFFDKPYYLEPQKAGVRAYALLREALNRSGRVGLAKVVIKTRQHLAAVKPEGDVLVLELMHFADELIDATSLNIPSKIQVAPKEIDLATELIGKMQGPWTPDEFIDEYRHALLQMIEDKVRSGGETPAHAPTAKPREKKIIDLVSVLQESLEHAQKSGTGNKAAKVAPKKARKSYRKAA